MKEYGRVKPLTPREFVMAWQAAPTIHTFCQVTGMSYKAATERASRYRKAEGGIRLKKFGRLDVAGLNIAAEEALAASA